MCFFIKAESSWKYEGIDSLKAIKLGVVKDYAYSEEVDSYITANPSGINAFSGDDALDKGIKLLIADRIGAFIDDDIVVPEFLKKTDQTSKVKVASCLEPDSIYIAFSPANSKSQQYADLLAEGTKKLRTSGKLKEILDKYGIKDWK